MSWVRLRKGTDARLKQVRGEGDRQRRAHAQETVQDSGQTHKASCEAAQSRKGRCRLALGQGRPEEPATEGSTCPHSPLPELTREPTP